MESYPSYGLQAILLASTSDCVIFIVSLIQDSTLAPYPSYGLQATQSPSTSDGITFIVSLAQDSTSGPCLSCGVQATQSASTLAFPSLIGNFWPTNSSISSRNSPSFTKVTTTKLGSDSNRSSTKKDSVTFVRNLTASI